MKTSKLSNKRSGLTGIIIGLAVGILVILIAALISTNLILKENLPIDSSDTISLIILFIGSLIGNVTGTKFVDQNKALYSLIYAAVLWVIVMVSGMLFFDGLSGRAVWNAAAVLASGVISAAITLVPVRKNKYKKMRHR